MHQYVLNLKTGELTGDVDFAEKAGLSYFQLIWFINSNENYDWYSTPSYIESYRLRYAKMTERLFGVRRPGKKVKLTYKKDRYKRKIKI